jgi:hypothetical protein
LNKWPHKNESPMKAFTLKISLKPLQTAGAHTTFYELEGVIFVKYVRGDPLQQYCHKWLPMEVSRSKYKMKPINFRWLSEAVKWPKTFTKCIFYVLWRIWRSCACPSSQTLIVNDV